jgi:hypothetical protein
MTSPTEWQSTLDELRNKGARWRAIAPHCSAIAWLVERLRIDPRVGKVSLQVSHATLVIGVTGIGRRVGIGWDAAGHYEVFLVEPGFVFVGPENVTHTNVVDVVIRYLDGIRT